MNKSKAIITTILLALMSAIILVTASVALFSKSVTVENYLQAGTLEVGLARTSLRGQIPDADGVLQQETTSSDRVDLTAAQTDDENDSVFTFGTSGVPGMWQEATLEIENRGNVAFDYSVAFFFTSTPEAGSAEERLAGKLLVTVTDAQGNVLTDEGTTLAGIIERGALPLGSVIEEGEKQMFCLKVELPLEENVLDDGSGETIMNAKLSFNITVAATQKVS